MCIKNQNQITDIRNGLIRITASINDYISYTTNQINTKQENIVGSAIGGCGPEGGYAVASPIIPLNNLNGGVEMTYQESVFNVEAGRAEADKVMQTLTWPK